MLKDAQALEQAGAFAIVLEGIPSKLAEVITASVNIPTIGIGAERAVTVRFLCIRICLECIRILCPSS